MHTMTTLFDQLGLRSDQEAIESFVAAHKPLPEGIRLHRAPFWSKAQSEFLRDELLEDADWAAVIDELDSELRADRESVGARIARAIIP
jgi:hypothetical protein